VPVIGSWHQEIAATYPGLIDAVSLAEVRPFRASVGGRQSVQRLSGGRYHSALIVHSAMCVIVGPNGRREIPVEQFCTGPGRTALQPGEFLVALCMPSPPPHFGAQYLRFIPRNEMDIAVVGVGASVVLNQDQSSFVSGRVALGAVAPTPLLVETAAAALGSGPDETISRLLRLEAAARPIDDMRERRNIDDTYRVLTRRALRGAIQRAKSGKRHAHESVHCRCGSTVEVEFLCEPRQSLLEVLRDVLRLTGSKKGVIT
jgi:carbon-monoxide dehydrogenase medium subunit